jgi:hypothetical protein
MKSVKPNDSGFDSLPEPKKIYNHYNWEATMYRLDGFEESQSGCYTNLKLNIDLRIKNREGYFVIHRKSKHILIDTTFNPSNVHALIRKLNDSDIKVEFKKIKEKGITNEL